MTQRENPEGTQIRKEHIANIQKQGVYKQYNGSKFTALNSYSECKQAQWPNPKTGACQIR